MITALDASTPIAIVLLPLLVAMHGEISVFGTSIGNSRDTSGCSGDGMCTCHMVQNYDLLATGERQWRSPIWRSVQHGQGLFQSTQYSCRLSTFGASWRGGFSRLFG